MAGLIVGISGASGTVYGIELLKLLREAGVETHLIMTKSAIVTMKQETDWRPGDVRALATRSYSVADLAAPMSSGSFPTRGMVVAPCSVKTLSGIVNCYEDNLLLRAAGVTLKEGRTLVLMLRETPLHVGHIRLMHSAAGMGARLFPPVPSFYSRPKTVEDIVRYSCARVLDQFGFEVDIERWSGPDRSVAGDRPLEHQRAPDDGADEHERADD